MDLDCKIGELIRTYDKPIYHHYKETHDYFVDEFKKYEARETNVIFSVEKLNKIKELTRLGLGRHSIMEKSSLAFPSGSSGRQTLSASTNMWYKDFVSKGSGSSRR